MPARGRGVQDVVVDFVDAAVGGHAGRDVGGLAEAVLRRGLRLLASDGDFVQGVDVVIVVVVDVFCFGAGKREKERVYRGGVGGWACVLGV